MNKVYVLFYDEEDNGARENWNTFHTSLEVYTDLDICNQRMDFIEKRYPGVVCHIVESDISTVSDKSLDDEYSFLLEDEDSEVSNDYDAPTDPAEYLFYAYDAESPWAGETGEDIRSTMIAVCPEEYFKKTGYQWDQHTALDFSDKISEVMEGLFEYDGTVEEARAELLAMGLKEDAEYTKFVKFHNQPDDDSVDAETTEPDKEVEEPYVYQNAPWLSVDPDDYFFNATLAMDPLGSGKRVTVIHIVPIRYFEAEHTMCTEHPRIDLPIGFTVAGPGCYVFNGSPSAARAELRDMTMQEDTAFNEVSNLIASRK